MRPAWAWICLCFVSLNFMATTNVRVCALSCTFPSSCPAHFSSPPNCFLAGCCKKLILNFTLIPGCFNAPFVPGHSYNNLFVNDCPSHV